MHKEGDPDFYGHSKGLCIRNKSTRIFIFQAYHAPASDWKHPYICPTSSFSFTDPHQFLFYIFVALPAHVQHEKRVHAFQFRIKSTPPPKPLRITCPNLLSIMYCLRRRDRDMICESLKYDVKLFCFIFVVIVGELAPSRRHFHPQCCARVLFSPLYHHYFIRFFQKLSEFLSLKRISSFNFLHDFFLSFRQPPCLVLFQPPIKAETLQQVLR